jgi:hypothetical protein
MAVCWVTFKFLLCFKTLLSGIIKAWEVGERMIPEDLRVFFWDTDPSLLVIHKDWFYIIERLLDYGNDKSLVWVLQTYSKQQIREVVCGSRRIKEKTASFWKNYFGLIKEDMKCLHAPSPINYWSY